MNTYNPDTAVNAAEWLAADESDRIELVSASHRRLGVRLPNAQLHAVIHVVVENQLALEDPVVVRTLARLQTEGLTRHDAIHAIGSLLAEDVYGLMHEGADRASDVYARYLERLRTLTAAGWKAG